jgi:hypothetical protein
MEGAPTLLLGRSLNASDVQNGLRELNPDITFDAALNRPSEYQFVLKGDNMTEKRGGVFYSGRYVCALDRGVIPEHAVWNMVDGMEEIRMCDIERYDATRVIYVEVLQNDPNYNVALLKAEKGDDNFVLDGDGRVFKFRAVREGRVRDRVEIVGWRHTFERLLAQRIPNITIKTLEEKFGVRM